MYASLARFGYGIAKSLQPSNVKKIIDAGKSKIPASMKPNITNVKAKKVIEGASIKTAKGYSKAYEATLGTPTRRKVTSGVLATSFINDILND